MGTFILPTVGLIWTLVGHDVEDVVFWWNIIFFGNSVRLGGLIFSGSFWQLLKQAKKPERAGEDYNPVSLAIKECPTRNFKVGNDIYTFAFYLSQKKKVFRDNGLLE